MWNEEITSYDEAERYILEIPKFTQKNTFGTSCEFYEKLHCPGETANIIHVAGTNGKGSVCSYINSILLETGHTVGMFTSPHLVSMRERFLISGEQITKGEFLEVFLKVGEIVVPPYHPTFFELLFYMAMLVFEKRGVEYIILETGMGGRLDTTNVIKKPTVCILTKIGMDHMEYLGNTLVEIADEKAGIIKENVPVVYLEDKKEVTDRIKTKISEKSAISYPVSCQTSINYVLENKKIDFSFKSRYYDYVSLTLSTQAVYQVENVLLAITAVEVLDCGKTITKQHIQKAVLTTKWDGRMEEIRPNVFVDGAHNEDGIQAFLTTIKATGKKNNSILFSAVQDKQYEKMMLELVKSGLFSKIAVTVIPNKRATSVEELQRIAEQYTKQPVTTVVNTTDALKQFIITKKEQETLYIVGSLYLVGMIKEITF